MFYYTGKLNVEVPLVEWKEGGLFYNLISLVGFLEFRSLY
jgi:hypothetical protein